MDEFLALSSLLTGLKDLRSLAPASIQSRMANDYLRLMKEQFGPGIDKLLAIYRPVANAPDPLKAVLQDPGFGGDAETAARQVVNLWMLSQYGGGPGKVQIRMLASTKRASSGTR